MKKCIFCGKVIEQGESVMPYQNGEAHVDCFNLSLRILVEDKNKKLKKTNKKDIVSKKRKIKINDMTLPEAMNEAEQMNKLEYQKLLKSLSEKYNIDITLALAKSASLLKAYSTMTYDTMTTTIKYICNHKENIEGDIVGLIPYYHEKALQEAEQLKHAIENNKQFLEKKGIGINNVAFNFAKQGDKYNNKKFYDLDAI